MSDKAKKDILIGHKQLSIDVGDTADKSKVPSEKVVNGDSRNDTNSPAPSDGKTTYNIASTLRDNCEFTFFFTTSCTHMDRQW